MVFIDNLAANLFAISFGGFLLLYVVLSMSLDFFRNHAKDYQKHLKGSSVPMLVVGIYLFASAFWGQSVWPLPGSYNILFYDPLIAFGILLIAFSLAIRYRVSLEYAGFLGLMVGFMTIGYGIQGYNIGLTSAPIALLAMYFFYGIAGILSYPVALIADRLPGLQKKPWAGWYMVLALFCIFLFLASGVAALVGIGAVPAHLVLAP